MLLTAFGGLAIGTICGLLGIAAVGRSSEHLVEAALTTVVAYGSFLVAERLHVSGVLATVAAGLVIGNLGVLRAEEKNPLSLKGREFVLDFWEFAAFLVNSIVFPLIGANVCSLA